MREKSSMSVEAASGLLLKYAASLETERLPLLGTVGRICGEDVAAAIDQPPFDRSAVDGYAIRRIDLANASPQAPIRLPVTQRLYAGPQTSAVLLPGRAARIMTGAPIPEGADCVVPQEAVDEDQTGAVFKRNPPERDNICRQGESIPSGTLLVSRGTRLGFAHIGMLAGQGRAEAAVFQRPRVAVLPTGDELQTAGSPLPPGGIYDSNCAMLCARLLELGAVPIPLPPSNDGLEELCRRIRGALEDCHMAITTGGVSVGQKDLLPQAAERLGSHILFHGIDAKPGTPALGAVLYGKPLLCLSGNPFAALVTFELLARPLVRRFSGWDEVPRRCRAVLDSAFEKSSNRRRFVRAILTRGHVSFPQACHSSGGLAGLAQCNCLADIPAGSPPLRPGDTVEIIML